MKKFVAALIAVFILTTTVFAEDGFIRVDNGVLRKGEEELVLNGVNLGGWLLMETWMGPVEDDYEEMAYSDVVSILINRFGRVRGQKLLDIYEDNFITEKDFEIIKELGFNCIRLPFWYRNFMTVNGEWLNGGEEHNPGFKRLDWTIAQCEKNGLYVILDMHGCPGGQSMNHSTGEIGSNRLYKDEKNLKMMETLWTAIGKRYNDNKTVIAYDIMNEPQNNTGHTGNYAWQAESKEAVELTNYVYSRMIDAIREVDKNHIITIEGIWTIDVLPDPREKNWYNMMYQLHIYDNTIPSIDKRIRELVKAREEWGVAPLAGEYHSSSLESYATGQYKRYSVNRIKWTYKTMGDSHNNWGLFNKGFDKIDIGNASYEEIEEAFSLGVRTENGFVFNSEEYEKIL